MWVWGIGKQEHRRLLVVTGGTLPFPPRRFPIVDSPIRRCPAADTGSSILETVVVFALCLAMATMVVPLTARAVDASAGRDAAAFVAAHFRLARQQAVMGGRSVGLVFDDVGGRWVFKVCRDGNRNGLRRGDITSMRDICDGEVFDLTRLFHGVTFRVDPGIPGPEGDPPSGRPIRFGRSDLASFSPDGGGTAGSVFVRSPDGHQYVIRVSNITARTRVLRFDASAGRWEP